MRPPIHSRFVGVLEVDSTLHPRTLTLHSYRQNVSSQPAHCCTTLDCGRNPERNLERKLEKNLERNLERSLHTNTLDKATQKDPEDQTLFFFSFLELLTVSGM